MGHWDGILGWGTGNGGLGWGLGMGSWDGDWEWDPGMGSCTGGTQGALGNGAPNKSSSWENPWLLPVLFPLPPRTEIFSGKAVTHEDIKYEQACVLYNLGELPDCCSFGAPWPEPPFPGGVRVSLPH